MSKGCEFITRYRVMNIQLSHKSLGTGHSYFVILMLTTYTNLVLNFSLSTIL